MTMIFPEDKVCALCGHASSQFEMASSNAFGSADLDTRPPEMMRSTMYTWVQKCPYCGFCNADITKAVVNANDVIKTEKYRNQLNDSEFPELANDFLCYSMILVESNKHNSAAWACVNAAWDCDDNEDQERATNCRNKAIDLFKIAESKDVLSMEQDGAYEALMCDLYRRSGRLEEAVAACKAGLELKPDAIIEEVLNFEKWLIQKKDTSCYTIEDSFNHMNRTSN